MSDTKAPKLVRVKGDAMEDLAEASSSYVSLKFRLYPNSGQAKRLSEYITHARHCYNQAIEHRIHAVKNNGNLITFFDQTSQLTKQRAASLEMRDFPREVQNAGLRRAESAFKNFFRRCREGAKKKGFPRFKSASRFTSMTFGEFPIQNEMLSGRIRLPKITKSVRVRGLRAPQGVIKQLTIIHRAGKWHGRLLIQSEIPQLTKRQVIKPVGIDVGLNSFISTTDGEFIACPKHYRRLQPALKRAQRLVARRTKGSKRRGRAILRMQRVYEKIENCREDFLHKLSKRLVVENDLIATEKLNIRNMVRSKLAKSILDAGWGRFNWMLHYKAEKAGVTYIQVNARGTSQECSRCGAIVRKDLAERIHRCECGLVLDRDVNAARNVLARALKQLTTPDAASADNACRESTATDLDFPDWQVDSLKYADLSGSLNGPSKSLPSPEGGK